MNNKPYPTRKKRNITSSLNDNNNPKVAKLTNTTKSSSNSSSFNNSSSGTKLNKEEPANDNNITPKALSTFNCMPIHSSRSSKKYKQDNSPRTNRKSLSTSSITDRRTKHGRNIHFLQNCLNAIAPSQSSIQRNTTIPVRLHQQITPTHPSMTSSTIHHPSQFNLLMILLFRMMIPVTFQI